MSGAGVISTRGIKRTWSVITSDSAVLSKESGYIANSGSLINFTLPATSSIGDTFEIVGKGIGKWEISQNADQYIVYGKTQTTTGITGKISAEHERDIVELVCTAENVEFTVVDSLGNITIV
jgi:hypothetical protein